MIEDSNNDSSRSCRILHYTWIWEYVLLFILIVKLIVNICNDKFSYYSWMSDHTAVSWHVAYLYIEISYAERWVCISFKDINSCYIQNSEEWMNEHFLRAFSVKKKFIDCEIVIKIVIFFNSTESNFIVKCILISNLWKINVLMTLDDIAKKNSFCI